MFRKSLCITATVMACAIALADRPTARPITATGNRDQKMTAATENRTPTATNPNAAGPQTVHPYGTGDAPVVNRPDGGIAACYNTCTVLTPGPLNAGDTLSWTGDNLCATYPYDCTAFGYLTSSWEPCFTTTTSLDVTLEYCGSVNLFYNAWLNLAIDCPCSSFSSAASYGWTCGDGRLQMTWGGLPAGTYYYPILNDPSYDSSGTYTITITAATPPPPPPNDNCTAVTPTTLNPGSSVTFYGDSGGSTVDCAILGAKECWEAVDLTGPAGLTIDFCGTSPAFNTVYIVIVPDCPCSTYIFAGGYDFFTCGDGNATISYCGLTAGVYYIPVYAEGSNNHAYTMTVTATGAGTPPANDDCSAVTPVALVAGVPQTFNGDNANSTHDCSLLTTGCGETWEAFETTECLDVTIEYCGTSPVFGNAYIVLAQGCPCYNYVFYNYYDFGCSDGNVRITWYSLPAGIWYYPVLNDPGYGASGPYTLTVTGTACPPPPPNDDCSSVTPQTLNPGDTLVFNGNTAGATNDCAILGAREVWEAIDLTGTSDVTVSLCGTTPPFNTMYIVIVPDCPCSTYIFADTYDFACSDFNGNVYYFCLPAGQYWIPVYAEAGAIGPYTLTVSAVGCAPGYCKAYHQTFFEYIDGVDCNTISHFDYTWQPNGYGDFTSISTNMDIGSSYPITIYIGNPWSSDIGGAWADWNQDLDFDDVDEYIPCSGSGAGPYFGTVTVPAGATPGPTRLRVRMVDGSADILEPCGTKLFGECHDYTIVVGGACCASDTNCDGSVNGFDIQGFIDCLNVGLPSNPCSPCICDTNGDGSINGFDIQEFVDDVNDGGCD